jgi:hypothetical protein
MEDDTQQQQKKQYDWLKGYQFVKGKSGNPGGRPKGAKSMKTFAREYFEKLPDSEKIKFLETLNPEIVWRMSEGNPATNLEAEIKGSISVTFDNSFNATTPKTKGNSK